MLRLAEAEPQEQHDPDDVEAGGAERGELLDAARTSGVCTAFGTKPIAVSATPTSDAASAPAPFAANAQAAK